jgi:hypothetical protein
MDDIIQKSTTTANTATKKLPGVYLGHCIVPFDTWLLITSVFCIFRSLYSNIMFGYSIEFAWEKIPIIFVENKINMLLI